MTYAHVERHDEAVAALGKCLELSDPTDSHVRKAYSLLAGALVKLGRHEEAWRVCAQGLGLYPRDSELLFRSGTLAQHFGWLVEAERIYLAVLAKDEPRHFASIDCGILGFKSHHNLALVYAETGALDKSEEQWRLATRDAPRYGDGWRGLLELLSRRGKHQEIAAVAEQLTGDPQLRPLGLAWRAHLPRVEGRGVEACQGLRSALAEYPEDLDLLHAWCHTLFAGGVWAECEAALLRLVQLSPANPAAHFNLGTLYLRSGRAVQAVEAFRESIRLRLTTAASHLHLGQALAALGRSDEAAESLREALRLDPNNRTAQEALGRLRKSAARQPVGAAMSGDPNCREYAPVA
jgi:Flp pilus assembly protein TadD